MIALGVIALTFLSIVALLGLALTTSRITVSQRDAMLRNRAADGAIEAATASIAQDPGTPCEAVPTSPVPFVDPDGGQVEAVVECVPGDGSQLLTDLDLGGPFVDVVGGSAAPGSTEPVGIRHSGAAPIRFQSDVRVRRSSSLDVLPDGPGLVTVGQYAQGSPGPGRSGTDCGALAAPGPGQVRDRNGVPVCGLASLVTAPVIVQDLGSLGATPGVVPTSCGAGSVVRLTPGFYGAAQVRALNTLFASSGCNGRTFHFDAADDPNASSVYVFDANDPSAGADRSALVIDNPSINVVFGEYVAPVAGSPARPLCDRDRSGASIELTARTAIRHRSGRLAVCPSRAADNTPLPAVTQVPVASVAPVGAVVGTSQFTPSANLLSRTSRSTAAFPLLCGSPSGCPVQRSFETRWTNLPDLPIQQVNLLFNSQERPPTVTSRRNVLVRVTPQGAPAFECTAAAGRTHEQVTAIDLVRCSGGALSSGQSASFLEGAVVRVRFEYLVGANIFNFSSINLDVWNVRLEVNAATATAAGVTSGNWQAAGRATTDDDQAATYIGNLSGPVSAWDTRGSTKVVGFDDLRFPAGSLATDPAVEPSVPLSSLNLVLLSRSAVLTGDSTPTSSAVADPGDDDASVEVRVDAPGGGVCTFTLDGYANSSRPVRFDLLANCPQYGRLDAIQGADVQLTYRVGCSRPVVVNPGNPSQCAVVRPPDLQFVGLTATTDYWSPVPPSSELTTNVTGAAPGGRLAEVHVFGDFLTKDSTVVLRWTGTAPGAGGTVDEPLVAGTMQVGRIESSVDGTSQTGVVCCTPEPPDPEQGRLQAVVDGRVWAESLVEVDSSDGTATLPRPVRILDWTYCASRSCGPRKLPDGP